MAEMTDNFPLVLVDGSSFLYRAYHASKQGFSNSKGIPTGVSLIITRMLKKPDQEILLIKIHYGF